MKLGAALLAGLFALSGCATSTGFGTGRTGGSDGGNSNGGRPKTTEEMISAMGGGLIGGTLGNGLDARERRKALEAEYRALEYTQSGNNVAWSGDRAGRSGTVVPAQPYRVGSQDCRQYQHTVTIDGTSRSARGTACRNPDGSWSILS